MCLSVYVARDREERGRDTVGVCVPGYEREGGRNQKSECSIDREEMSYKEEEREKHTDREDRGRQRGSK